PLRLNSRALPRSWGNEIVSTGIARKIARRLTQWILPCALPERLLTKLRKACPKYGTCRAELQSATRSMIVGVRSFLSIGMVGLLMLLVDHGDPRAAAEIPRGCAAVNFGAMDLNSKIDSSGLTVALTGLGFVKESQAGDVLIRTQDGKADSAPFVHQLRV